MHLTETHFHTSLSSPCANVLPEEAVAMYERCGYSTVVVTDHFSRFHRDHYNLKDDIEWVDHFLMGYRSIRKLAASMHILLGMEIKFDENSNEYLVFGLSEEDLYHHPDMYAWRIREFRKHADKNGWLVIQAHPFRDYMTVISPSYIDGIEVFNGNHRHNSRNEIARHWGEINGLLTTAGSDYHQMEDAARGGLVTDKPIETVNELITAIRNGAGIYSCSNH